MWKVWVLCFVIGFVPGFLLQLWLSRRRPY